jgi:hypothetical protein
VVAVEGLEMDVNLYSSLYESNLKKLQLENGSMSVRT